MDTQFQACQPSTSKVSFASEEEVFVVSGAESRPEPFGDACDDCVDSSSSCAAKTMQRFWNMYLTVFIVDPISEEGELTRWN